MPTCEQIDNARRLAIALEKVAAEWPEGFYMGSWVAETERLMMNFDEAHGLIRDGTATPAECGTTGCALGWAPWATGVRLRNESWIDYGFRLVGCTTDEFVYLFVSNDAATREERGESGARNAAARLWEYVDQYQSLCEEGL